MPGRVLTFSEFNNKYSKDSDNTKEVKDLSAAADNFQEGFDKDTYQKDNFGPNKPVSSGSEMTPAQPGEAGAPKFSSKATMPVPEAPEETEEEESEEEEDEIEISEPEEEPESEEEEEDEVPEPEATDESLFADSFDVFTQKMNESEESVVVCEACGGTKPMDGETPEDDSWYSEQFGMNCGCSK